MRRAPTRPNSPRDIGVGEVNPRAIQPDTASKSKVRQTIRLAIAGLLSSSDVDRKRRSGGSPLTVAVATADADDAADVKYSGQCASSLSEWLGNHNSANADSSRRPFRATLIRDFPQPPLRILWKARVERGEFFVG